MSSSCQLPQTVDTSKQYRGEKFTYVVDGAKVWCDKSQKQKGSLIDLRPPARGATSGYELKVLDVDTKLDNFDPQTFDICNDGTECVLTQLNDRWDNISNNIGFSEKLFMPSGVFSAGISVALGKSSTFSNAMFPISIESRLICWKFGGVIQIEENGQVGCGDADHMIEYPEGTTEEEKTKWKAQSEQYLKMYGVHPQSLDELDDLFFLTDSRLNMSGTEAAAIFFMYQFERSNNLYTLATTYPYYYKLGDRYGLGTLKYNEKIEELSAKLFHDLVDKKTTSLYDEDYWKPAEKLNDTISNALVEQAIYEMNNNRNYASSISDEDWSTFTSTINYTIGNISSKSTTGSEWYNYILGGSNLSKVAHYERNAFNRAPSTIEEIYGKSDSWNLVPVSESIYHMNGIDGEYNMKFISRDGKYEAVYNKEGKLLTLSPKNNMEKKDSLNASTYNYGPMDTYLGIFNHHSYDMDPYYEFGGLPDSPASSESSGNVDKYNNSPEAQLYRKEQEDKFKRVSEEFNDGLEIEYEG